LIKPPDYPVDVLGCGPIQPARLLAHALQRLRTLHFEAGEAYAAPLLYPVRNTIGNYLAFPGAAGAAPKSHFAGAEEQLIADFPIGDRIPYMLLGGGPE
jgi:hypothetical protein